jgi:hypothetical protein
MVENIVVENGSMSAAPVPIECAVEDVDNMKMQVSIQILNTGPDQEIAGNFEVHSSLSVHYLSLQSLWHSENMPENQFPQIVSIKKG